MKGAFVIGTLTCSVARFNIEATADGQRFIELHLRPSPLDEVESVPTFRTWLPLSPKSIAELAEMGVYYFPRDGMLVDVVHRDHEPRPFLIDLVSVPCSDEEAHGTEAQRLFVRRPRPLTERK